MSDTSSATDPDLPRRCAALVDDAPYARARADADELGARPLDPVAADTLRQIARLLGARGTVCLTPALGAAAVAVLGAGVGGAVITCIDSDPHLVDAARTALKEAGHVASSARFITARPLEVLEKLADDGYDLVVAEVSGDDAIVRVVDHAARMLRAGGALILVGEHAPLPKSADLPEDAHVSVLPVGTGLTLITL